jgi:Subtilase family/Bacterial pre-peptidase C-terminal domain
MRRALVVLLLALVAPGTAEAARFAVGVAPGADRADLARALEARTGGRVEPLAPFAVVLEAESAAGAADLPGVAYVERLGHRGRRLAFAPTDPLFPKQWYAGAVQAFEGWSQRPLLPGMRIAVIDSGVDGGHPEFRRRIATHKSFVGGSALRDVHGHGTFVSGLIGASLNNGEGIAGMAFPAQLLVAKVVRSDGVVPLEAEARAIRWAVDNHAQVINLSLGGVRDPRHAGRDSFSPLEASAVEYAVRKGVIVVAAVGNGDNGDRPWRYASYPAALPHVLGVSAYARDGSVPMFSNRDPVYNDISAPGDELFSTLPRHLTALRPTCLEQGYSDCGPPEFRRPQGTSFAAAIVSAGAVVVRAAWPNLRDEQIIGLIERTATDMIPTTGCRRCTPDRDAISGWGSLNVSAAVNYGGRLPAIDQHEPNDDAGARAFRIRPLNSGRRAALDYWNDPNDVYSIRLRRNGRLAVTLTGKTESLDVNLYLWRPGTREIASARSLSRVVDRSAGPDAREFVNFRARRRPGVYYVQVKIMEPGSTGYTLRVVKR